MLFSFLKYINDRPLKVKLLFFFLPLIIISVLLTSVCSYFFAESQLRDNAYYFLRDTTYQTNILLDDRFSTMFEQLFIIENDPAFQNMILNQYDSDAKQQYLDIISINNRLNDTYRKYYKVIDSIYIYLNNGHEFQLMNESIPIKIGVNLNEWLTKYYGSRQNYYWLNDHDDRIYITYDKRRVMSCFKIIGTKSSKVKGLLVLNLKTNHFLDILRNVQVSANGYMMLLSPDGVLYSKKAGAEYRLSGNDLAKLRRKAGSSNGYFIRNAHGTKIFIVYNTLNVNQWMIAAVVPENDLLTKVRKIRDVTLVISVVLSFLSIVAAFLFAGTVTASLKYLCGQVREVESGNFDTPFVVRENNEIGVLANALTRLESTVKQLLQKIREEQEKKRQIELLALQSQINPHFLYNTLGSIKHLADMGENQRASKMVGALAKFFMIGISKGKEIITIREEIEHIRNYLLIQQMRYSTDFDFEFNIAPEILDCKIIKLTLQPLVENAIYHGIKNKPEKGIIRVSGCRSGEYGIIDVYDDGAGMDEIRLLKLGQSINTKNVEENPVTFGLRNVNLRLKLHFGQEYGLNITSQPNQYTRVQVKIPFLSQVNGGEENESAV